ncbi:transposase [Streptomyces sp. NBC_00564]|nr:transposase [Streptomyces sp. NBC_00564]
MRPPRGPGRRSRTAATTAACPDATQFADRFHLLQGLSRAVEKVCHQHRSCLKKHAERGQDRPIEMPLLDALPPTLIVQRVLNRHPEINRMVATGYPVSEIARRLSLDRKTVRHYRDTDLDMLLASPRLATAVTFRSTASSLSSSPSWPAETPVARPCSSSCVNRATRAATPPSPANSAPSTPAPHPRPPPSYPGRAG